eukprot:1160602-Pelagomonas_calceolata.AAC.2
MKHRQGACWLKSCHDTHSALKYECVSIAVICALTHRQRGLLAQSLMCLLEPYATALMHIWMQDNQK